MRNIYIAISVVIVIVAVFLYVEYVISRNTINNKITEAVNTVSPLENYNYKIIAYGDSLTAGLGVNINDTYPAKLERALRARSLPVTVINMGVSGDTTYSALSRVDFIINNKPKLVIVGLGANDMLQGLPIDETYKNLGTIINKLKANNIEVLLLGMQSTANNDRDYREKFNNMYVELADKYKLVLMPFMLENIALKSELNQSDGIHPTSEGYDVMIRNMLPYVLKYNMTTE